MTLAINGDLYSPSANHSSNSIIVAIRSRIYLCISDSARGNSWGLTECSKVDILVLLHKLMEVLKSMTFGILSIPSCLVEVGEFVVVVWSPLENHSLYAHNRSRGKFGTIPNLDLTGP